MPTPRQRKLAEAIAVNSSKAKPLNKSELLASAGYGVGTNRGSTARTIEQKGVQESLIEIGFTPNRAKVAVVEVLETGDDNNRLRAADMIFKVHGSYAAEKNITVNVDASIDAEAVAAMALRMLEADRKDADAS